ncbi:hypothetical protein ABZ438_20580 [Streptomyces sp. NPDC005786]|uniref:hypothetical protein n=1 Tax=Streptomyces sp. NPDC005786 TaxID=3154891 RepID=UPI0033F103EF
MEKRRLPAWLQGGLALRPASGSYLPRGPLGRYGLGYKLLMQDQLGMGKTVEAGTPGFPDLLVKEGQLLWLYYGHQSLHLDQRRQPVLVGAGGWANYDLAAPGDRTGNGHVDLIARNKSNGELRLYAGSGPDGQGLGDPTTSSVIGTAWTPINRPLITAGPDANSDGKADIRATNSTGELMFHSDLAGGAMVGTGGWSGFTSLS